MYTRYPTFYQATKAKFITLIQYILCYLYIYIYQINGTAAQAWHIASMVHFLKRFQYFAHIHKILIPTNFQNPEF